MCFIWGWLRLGNRRQLNIDLVSMLISISELFRASFQQEGGGSLQYRHHVGSYPGSVYSRNLRLLGVAFQPNKVLQYKLCDSVIDWDLFAILIIAKDKDKAFYPNITASCWYCYALLWAPVRCRSVPWQGLTKSDAEHQWGRQTDWIYSLSQCQNHPVGS